MFNLRKRHSPIGICLDGDVIRMLQLVTHGETARVHAACEIEVGDADRGEPPWSDALASRIQKARQTGGFHGHRAIVALPSDTLIERHVKVEATEGQARTDALLFELEPSFPGDAPIVQHLDVGEVMERGERRHELIVLAAGLKPVNALLDFLERADLEPIAIDAPGCALIRCFMHRRRRSSDSETQTAILHIGADATLMTITAGGHPMFMKQLPLGSKQLFETISQRLGLARDEVRCCPGTGVELDDAADFGQELMNALRLHVDSLALELSACLRYHAASRRASSALEILLTGDGAEIPGLSDALAATLDQTISRPDPFSPYYSGVAADRRTGSHFPQWAMCLGLALREVES